MTPRDLDRAFAAFARTSQIGRTSRDLPLLPHSQPVRALRPIGHTTAPVWTRWAWLAAALAMVVAGLAAFGTWDLLGTQEAAPHRAPESIRTVDIDRPAPAAGSSVALPATVRPWQTVELHARVNGYLAGWTADLGQQVKARDVLATIDTPELDQELAQAEALTQESLAAVAQAKAEFEEAKSDLKVAEAQLVGIQAEAVLAKSQLARREKLRASKAIPQEEYDAMLRQLEARTAEVTAAEADVDRRRTSLDTRASVIEAREAMANSRASSAERLRELQGFKQIVAPFNGVITRRTAEVGMLVSADIEPLFVLEDLSRVRVQTNVPQAHAAGTQRGASAKVMLPDSAQPPAEAVISRTSESVDPASRTLLAEIEIDNADHRFRPGSDVQVALSTSDSDTIWTIPSNTVLMRVDGPHVAIVDQQDKVRLQSLRLGRDFGRRIAVLEGIEGSERLVVNPSDDLVDGMPVVAVRKDATPGDLAQR